jgi:hypothetical protein
MDIRRTELLKALKQCLPGIESRDILMQGADLFVFTGGFIYSYNNAISVRVPIESEGLIEAHVEGAVKAQELYDIVNKLTGDSVTFTVKKKSWVLESGRARAELVLMEGDFSKRLAGIEPDSKKWELVPPEFLSGIRACRMQKNHSTLSGVFITESDIMSTDGFQMNRWAYKGPKIKNTWIGDEAVAELLKFDSIAAVQIKESWALFNTKDGAVFSVKVLDDKQWPHDKLLSVIEKNKKEPADPAGVFPKALYDVVDRASSFYMDIAAYKGVKLDISPDKITVTAKRPSGSFSESVDWEEAPGDFEPFTILVDVSMILFSVRRSLAFHIHKPAETAARIVFTTENSLHIMTTLVEDYPPSGPADNEAAGEEEKPPASKPKAKTASAKPEKSKPAAEPEPEEGDPEDEDPEGEADAEGEDDSDDGWEDDSDFDD